MSRKVDVKALVSHILRGDGSDRCRICMGDTSEGQVYLGDTVMIDDDKAVSLAELLETITGIQVPLEVDLPAGLCSTCFSDTMQAGHFRDLCLRANDQWRATLNLLDTIPEYNTQNRLFAILADNKIHFIDDFLEEKPKKEPSIKQEYNRSLKCQCPTCGKQFQYAQHLSKHLKESTDNLRACHICAEILNRNDLVKHLKSVHCRDPYDCKKCPALFKSRQQYKLHLIKAHAPGACTCGDCGRTFRNDHGYHAHLSVHAPKTCPGCDKLFRNQTCYVYHVKLCCNLHRDREGTHETKHKFSVLVKNQSSNKKVKVGLRGSANKECICDYCHKKFAGRKFVSAHIQIVHMKNTHKPCPYCGKFLAAAHMTEHLKKHESNETYTCEKCGITLKTRLGYKQHIRLHTGEKPYACKFCGETFSASSRRSEHVRKVHKSSDIVLKHACELCPARFRLPYRLRKHMVSVHGDGKDQGLMFICTVCQAKFSSCSGLLHHSRKHQTVLIPRNVHKKINLDVIE